MTAQLHHYLVLSCLLFTVGLAGVLIRRHAIVALIGIELMVPARSYCERLKDLGLLCKETHDYVIRLAPPLIISQEDLAWAAGQVRRAFEE